MCQLKQLFGALDPHDLHELKWSDAFMFLEVSKQAAHTHVRGRCKIRDANGVFNVLEHK